MNEETIYIPTVVPVFPLPQVVLFPGTLLPLHVFEERYRDMVMDALQEESNALAIALLRPGFESLYYTPRAPIHEIVGVARIVASEETNDDKYNILIHGLLRARIVDESHERSYRRARIEPIHSHCSSGDVRSRELRRELLSAIRHDTAIDPELRRHWIKLFDTSLDLEELTDLIGAGMPSEPELRQCLLNETDASERVEMLLEQLHTLEQVSRVSRGFGTSEKESLN